MGLPAQHRVSQREAAFRRMQQFQRIARCYPAGSDNPPVPAGQPMFGDEGSHAVAGEALINFPARVARLADLQLGAAKAPDVTDPDVVFVEFGRRDVFTEAADDELWRGIREAFGQLGVMARRVEVDGLFRAAVHAAVGQLVADEAFGAEFERTAGRLLVHAGRATGLRERPNAADEEGYVCHGRRILPSIP